MSHFIVILKFIAIRWTFTKKNWNYGISSGKVAASADYRPLLSNGRGAESGGRPTRRGGSVDEESPCREDQQVRASVRRPRNMGKSSVPLRPGPATFWHVVPVPRSGSSVLLTSRRVASVPVRGNDPGSCPATLASQISVRIRNGFRHGRAILRVDRFPKAWREDPRLSDAR